MSEVEVRNGRPIFQCGCGTSRFRELPQDYSSIGVLTRSVDTYAGPRVIQCLSCQALYTQTAAWSWAANAVHTKTAPWFPDPSPTPHGY